METTDVSKWESNALLWLRIFNKSFSKIKDKAYSEKLARWFWKTWNWRWPWSICPCCSRSCHTHKTTAAHRPEEQTQNVGQKLKNYVLWKNSDFVCYVLWRINWPQSCCRQGSTLTSFPASSYPFAPTRWSEISFLEGKRDIREMTPASR